MKKLCLALTLLVLPVVAIAQKTSYDYDKTATFQAYKTYALRDGTKVGDKLIDDRFVAALDAELARKGLTKSETPDILVAYHVAFDKQQDVSAFSTGGGPYGWRWGGGWSTTDVRVREILIGTLVIDVVDAKRNEVAWRGIGVKEVNPQAKPDKRDRNINDAVKKILKNYPPSAKT
jgi:hypothetical protein